MTSPLFSNNYRIKDKPALLGGIILLSSVPLIIFGMIIFPDSVDSFGLVQLTEPIDTTIFKIIGYILAGIGAILGSINVLVSIRRETK